LPWKNRLAFVQSVKHLGALRFIIFRKAASKPIRNKMQIVKVRTMEPKKFTKDGTPQPDRIFVKTGKIIGVCHR
jgi:hypothetical protein